MWILVTFRANNRELCNWERKFLTKKLRTHIILRAQNAENKGRASQIQIIQILERRIKEIYLYWICGICKHEENIKKLSTAGSLPLWWQVSWVKDTGQPPWSLGPGSYVNVKMESFCPPSQLPSIAKGFSRRLAWSLVCRVSHTGRETDTVSSASHPSHSRGIFLACPAQKSSLSR